METRQAVTPAFACLVVTDDQYRIVETAPLLRRFVGQRLINLVTWMDTTFPWWQLETLPTHEEITP